MTVYLLDANVLIALFEVNHPHAKRVDAWFGDFRRFAVCPITEGALTRFLVRNGESNKEIQKLLDLLGDHAGYEFWPDSISYSKADLSSVIGHKQVTDAYLVSLVRQHPQAQLVTLDQGLAQTYPQDSALISV